MTKFLKFTIVFAALLVVMLLVASLVLRAYLTDERLRTMIIPPVEKILGRSVEIGHITVSLFSGIQVYDFVVKEENGQDTFVSAGHFVLAYEVLPLFQKKVVIRDIRLVDPTIQVVRDSNGEFNFSSLALLNREKGAAPPDTRGEQTTGPGAGLPFTVVVHNFSLENGSVQVQDALGEIPATALTVHADIALEMGGTLADLRYNGDLRFAMDTVYRKLPVRSDGRFDFDQDKVAFLVNLRLDQEALQFSGSVAQVMASGKLPPLEVNVSGREVNIDQLLASLAVLSVKEETRPVSRKTAAPTPSGSAVPPGLTAKGQVRIAKARYQKMTMTDFQLAYSLAEGIFVIRELQGHTMGGEVRGEVLVRLQEVPAYEGTIGVHGLQFAELQNVFVEKSPARAHGAVSGAMTFNGLGISPEQIKKEISALGEFAMQGARISGADFSRSLASLLDLPELNDLDLEDMAGNFTIKKGVVRVRATTTNASFVGKMKGSVGLDGTLNMPVTLDLSPRLSSRLESRLRGARYLEKKEDRIQVHLAVKGMVDSPRISLDEAQLRKQATDTLIRDVLGDDASPEEKAVGEAVKGLLDTLFGK